MQRLEILRAHLRDSAPLIWGEPFHEAWLSGAGLDERVRLARAQAAEMAAVRPFVKPGELIIGNKALRSVVSGLPKTFVTGIQFDQEYLHILRREHPESAARLDEIETYWTPWMAENDQYRPLTCHASLARRRRAVAQLP